MSSTIEDYFYDQYLEDHNLAERIEEGIEDFKKESLKTFYLKNNDVYARVFRVKKIAEDLEREGFLSPSFIFYCVCIELILKDLFIYPLVYGSLLDEEFAEIIIAEIFKTPVSKFDRLATYIVQEFGNLDITKKNDLLKRGPLEEIKKLRALRNRVIHSGVGCNKQDLERIKSLVEFLVKKTIPVVLSGVGVKVDNNNLIVKK